MPQRRGVAHAHTWVGGTCGSNGGGRKLASPCFTHGSSCWTACTSVILSILSFQCYHGSLIAPRLLLYLKV